MLPLIGVLVVVVGFALRLNPLLVVTIAGLATGLAGGLGLREVIEAFGRSFVESRYVGIVWLILPVIGLLERFGLQERAAAFRDDPSCSGGPSDELGPLPSAACRSTGTPAPAVAPAPTSTSTSSSTTKSTTSTEPTTTTTEPDTTSATGGSDSTAPTTANRSTLAPVQVPLPVPGLPKVELPPLLPGLPGLSLG